MTSSLVPCVKQFVGVRVYEPLWVWIRRVGDTLLYILRATLEHKWQVYLIQVHVRSRTFRILISTEFSSRSASFNFELVPNTRLWCLAVWKLKNRKNFINYQFFSWNCYVSVQCRVCFRVFNCRQSVNCEDLTTTRPQRRRLNSTIDKRMESTCQSSWK